LTIISYFSKNNGESDYTNLTNLKINEIKSILSKNSDCNICKATERLIAHYMKSSKKGKAENDKIAEIIFQEDKKSVDYRKINLEEFIRKRDQYKSIFV